MARQRKISGYLIFIDTNILLDFYRIRRSDISLKYLEQIENNKDKLILTSQVEMEFRKNRQTVILEALGEVNKISTNGLTVPTILFDAKPVDMIKKAQNKISGQQKKIKDRINKILENPGTQDKVFQTLQRVFKLKSEFYLDRENDLRYKIRKLALRRFGLGYPPRKKSDNSIGDSINWEWIIHCASICDKNIVIVTRDSDFGVFNNNKAYVNDWLQIEFKERISQQRKLILTDKLSKAFDMVNIPVTQEMREEEQKVIDEPRIHIDLDELLRKLQKELEQQKERLQKESENLRDRLKGEIGDKE
jgi:predicted nucleic acid-binding protein